MADEPEHQHYKQWLLKQACRCWPCAAPVEVHHHTHGETSSRRPSKALGGKRGKGQRASDAFGMPMCFRHHKELHNSALRGFFSDMDPRERRTWQDLQVSELRSLYAQEFPNGDQAIAAKSSRAQRPRSRDPEFRARERVFEQALDWAGQRRLLPEQTQMIHDLVNDLRAKGPGEF
ncbi:MAG TPA: hypothetical protein VJN18_32620 [Polyangiaceae bacterium]|nr:hypothetical protein [Polyangiaceae bacterium]